MPMDADLGQDIWEDLSWLQAVCVKDLHGFKAQYQPIPARVGCDGPEAVQEASYIPNKEMTSEFVCNRCCEPELSLFCPKSELSDNFTVILQQNASKPTPETCLMVSHLPQPIYSIFSWYHAIFTQLTWLDEDCDQDGAISHQEKAVTSLSYLLSLIYPILESLLQ